MTPSPTTCSPSSSLHFSPPPPTPHLPPGASPPRRLGTWSQGVRPSGACLLAGVHAPCHSRPARLTSLLSTTAIPSFLPSRQAMLVTMNEARVCNPIPVAGASHRPDHPPPTTFYVQQRCSLLRRRTSPPSSRSSPQRMAQRQPWSLSHWRLLAPLQGQLSRRTVAMRSSLGHYQHPETRQRLRSPAPPVPPSMALRSVRPTNLGLPVINRVFRLSPGRFKSSER